MVLLFKLYQTDGSCWGVSSRVSWSPRLCDAITNAVAWLICVQFVDAGVVLATLVHLRDEAHFGVKPGRPDIFAGGTVRGCGGDGGTHF